MWCLSLYVPTMRCWCFCHDYSDCSSPLPMGTPLLPKQFVLIREVFFREGGASTVVMVHASKTVCPFKMGVLSREGPLSERPLDIQTVTTSLLESEMLSERVNIRIFYMTLLHIQPWVLRHITLEQVSLAIQIAGLCMANWFSQMIIL